MLLNIINTTTLLEKHVNKQLIKNKNKKDILWYLTYKIRHTYWTLYMAQRIMTTERIKFFNKKLREKWEIATILHDIWRFYQNNWERVLTSLEFEHWDAWYWILKNEWINDLAILLSVKYHNKKLIDPLYKDKEYLSQNNIKKNEIDLITKLVRDADKLHNMTYMLYNIDRSTMRWIKVSENNVSKKVLEDFLEWKLIDIKDVKTLSDELLKNLAFQFDFNFKWSLKILKDSNFNKIYLEKLKKSWIGTKTFNLVENKIKKFNLI